MGQLRWMLTTKLRGRGLRISKVAVQNFMVNDCALTINKTHFKPKETLLPTSKPAFKWTANLMRTDIDFQSNCVLIDELVFCINQSRIMVLVY